MERVPHILIVEDDAIIARMTAKFLVDNGFRVTTVGDGRAMERVLTDRAQST